MPDSPQVIWNRLSSWLNHWYHEPDLEALQICLCAIFSHHYPDESPLWIMLIGPSGSGKTEIVAQTLSNIPGAQIVGDLNPKCFLSGIQNSKEEPSMLIAGGPDQIWISKDFTPFVSLRYDDRGQVAAHLRDVHDGRMSLNTGAGRKEWKGKVTFLAVATPEFEDSWAALKGLGDRFTTLRWRAPESRKEINRKRRLSAGQTSMIRSAIKEYVTGLCAARRTSNVMPSDEEMDQLDATAEIVCWLQTPVERNNDRERSIKRRPEREMSSRVGFGLSQIVRTYNDVFHGAPGGQALAKRLALDSIPAERKEVLEAMDLKKEISYREISKAVKIPHTTLTRTIEDMTWIGVLEFPEDENKDKRAKWPDRRTALTYEFRQMLSQSLIFLPRSSPVVPIQKASGHRGFLDLNY